MNDRDGAIWRPGEGCDETADPEHRDDTSLRRIIRCDLYNELRWLLVAATTWCAVSDSSTLGASQRRLPALDLPDHTIVLAFDSAIVHARALLEFFTMTATEYKGWDRKGKPALAVRAFGIEHPLSSDIFDTWSEAINARVAHIRRDRPSAQLTPGGLHLKDQVASLTNEVLRLWHDLTELSEMSSYRDLMEQVMMAAMDEADRAAATLGSRNPFAV